MVELQQSHNQASKSVLICDSAFIKEHTLQELAASQQWQIDRVADDQLLNRLAAYPYAAVICGVSANEHTFLQRMTQVVEASPQTVRIIICDHVSAASLSGLAELSHGTLTPVSSAAQISRTVERAIKINSLSRKADVGAYLDRLDDIPALPNVYLELNRALASGRASTAEITLILEKEPGVAAKVLQLINSPLFSLEQPISRINEAVTILGVRLVRDLMLAFHLYSGLHQPVSWTGFSFEQVFHRSILAARLAQDICRSVKADRHIQGQAFVAALLHDVGMLLLARENAEQYRAAFTQAATLNQPLYVVEKMALGVSHAELAAFLMERWGLPPRVVEAVLFHHFPASYPFDTFQPLTAVHVADALLPSVDCVLECTITSQLSQKYLQRLGIAEFLPRWQQLADNYQQMLPGV